MQIRILLFIICLLTGSLSPLCRATELSANEIKQLSREVDSLTAELSDFDLSRAVKYLAPTQPTEAITKEKSSEIQKLASTESAALRPGKQVTADTLKTHSGDVSQRRFLPTTSSKITDAQYLTRYIGQVGVKSKDLFYYRILRPGQGQRGCKKSVGFTMSEMDIEQKTFSEGHYRLRCELLPPIFHSAISLLASQGSIDLVTTAKNMYQGKAYPAGFNFSDNKVLHYKIELD